MNSPFIATYRLLLNPQFGFKSVTALLPYFKKLGISHLYLSPILQARQGSLHGYDVVNPHCLNPQLGTEQEFDELIQKIHENNMGLILDIVPHHMAIDQANPFLMDWFEKGEASEFSNFFDIDWTHDKSWPQIILPILGKPYKECLENGEIKLIWNGSKLAISYYDHRFPVHFKSYPIILSYSSKNQIPLLEVDRHQLNQILTAINTPSNLSSTQNDLKSLYEQSPSFKHYLDSILIQSNGILGNPDSFTFLDHLLQAQIYQLAFWKTGSQRINYRRFFNINHLIGLNTHTSQVIQKTHSLIIDLFRQNKIMGLRIDHIDGLKDPLFYLSFINKILQETSFNPYIIVEKILAPNELLPDNWPTAGTTGYEFSSFVDQVLIHPKRIKTLNKHPPFGLSFETIIHQQKKFILHHMFSSEFSYLCIYLSKLVQNDRDGRDLSFEELYRALEEITTSLSVYRTYYSKVNNSFYNRIYIETAILSAQNKNPTISKEVFDYLLKRLTLSFPSYLDKSISQEWESFLLKWQQLTPPLAAKGVEDTALYHYPRLISLNEVGGNPDSNGISLEDLFRFSQSRLLRYPHTLNASSTHDSKLGEDVRARIHLLSEIPKEWHRFFNHWHRHNRQYQQNLHREIVPDKTIEYYLYQLLLGSWPDDPLETPNFKERIKKHLLKVMREAKLHTNWDEIHQDYERSFFTFFNNIMNDSASNLFLNELLGLQKKISFFGTINSYVQTILKMTLPGVPDFYQGCELLQFYLVDPDNRRAVDYKHRESLLNRLLIEKTKNQSKLIIDLLHDWKTGALKLYLIYQTLQFRKQYAHLFTEGELIPLTAKGKRKLHIIAYARQNQKQYVLIILPRLILSAMKGKTQYPLGSSFWMNTKIKLAPNYPTSWTSLYEGSSIELIKKSKHLELSMGYIFENFPFQVLYAGC